jgi:hypothetical protein
MLYGFMLVIVFLMVAMSSYGAVSYSPPSSFSVDYIKNGYQINVSDGLILMQYVDVEGNLIEKPLITSVDWKDGNAAALSTTEDKPMFYKIMTNLSLESEDCKLKYQSLVIDLCNEERKNIIYETPEVLKEEYAHDEKGEAIVYPPTEKVEGFKTREIPVAYTMYSEAHTVVYTAGIISLTGINTQATITAALGNNTPMWRCWGKNCYTNSTIQINASAYLYLNPGESITTDKRFFIYGNLRINKSFIYMNDTDGTGDEFQVYATGNVNITGTPQADYIPTESTTFDAGISVYPLVNPRIFNFGVTDGGRFAIYDGRITGGMYYNIGSIAYMTLRRSKLGFFNSGSLYWFVSKPQYVKMKYDYITTLYKNGGASNLHLLVSWGTNNNFNISNIIFNMTGSGRISTIKYYHSTGGTSHVYDSYMDVCRFSFESNAAQIRIKAMLHNTTFTGADKISNCSLVLAAGSTYNVNNLLDFKFPINLQVKDNLGIPLSGATVKVYVKKYKFSGVAMTGWILNGTYTTNLQGKVITRDELLAKRIVYTNESFYYRHYINVTGTSAYNVTSQIVNLSQAMRSSTLNFTLNMLPSHYQAVYTNTTSTSLNISRLLSSSYLMAYFQSYNFTTGNISLWVNGTMRKTQSATNNTPSLFSSTLLRVGTHSLQFRFYNVTTSTYTLDVTNTTRPAPRNSPGTGYISIVMVIIAAVGFLLLLALKFDNALQPLVETTQKEYLLWAARMFFVTIVCWLMVALFSFLNSIIELEQYNNMTSTATGLFVVMVIISIFTSTGFVLGITYIGLKNLVSWGKKNVR